MGIFKKRRVKDESMIETPRPVRSKEQIEEASLCKTNEERMAFLSKNMIQLSDEMLDKISGGNDDDEYYCPTCKIRFDNFWDSVLHDLKHLTI